MSRSIGRPSKLTEETTQKLVEALEQGDTYAVACAAADIAYWTLRRWMIKGEKAKQGEYYDFYDTVNTALMVARGTMELRAFKETKPLEWLERRYPEDWGKKDQVELTGGGDLVINLHATNEPPDAKG